MFNLREICDNEFEKALSKPSIKKEFVEKNLKDMKQIFRYLFVVNYFKNRAETKVYFGNEYNVVYSLFLESVYALYTGQCRSALLLLRSTQEANFRHVLSKEREWIRSFDKEVQFEELNFRFVETAKKFQSDLTPYLDREKYELYFKTIESNLTHYKNLCGVVHSESSNQPVANVDYFSNVVGDTIVNEQKYFKLYIDTLDDMLTLIIFLLRQRFHEWDSYDLLNIFGAVYGKKRKHSLLSYVKS